MKTNIARRSIILLAILGTLTAPTFAQDEQKQAIVAGTGGAGGTYTGTYVQWQKICPAFNLTEYKVADQGKPPRNTNGTTENLDLLLSNKIAMAYVQADAVWNLLQKDPNVQNLRTLAVLYPEAVHVITPNKPVIVKVPGKVFGTNDQLVNLTTVESLSGFTVVAWGGSAITAGIIRDHILGGKLTVTEVNTKEEAIAKITAGEAQAMVVVGGYPIEWVGKLDTSWKMLPFPKTLRSKVGSTYADVNVTYTKMGAIGVETGQTSSMLIAQNYGPKRGRLITSAFDCMDNHMEDLRDGDGMHPAWKKINLNNRGNILPPFPFVRDATAPAPAPAPAEKPAKPAAKK
jgi:TRAP-type uncharacterized transport system substrate-binding protein